MIMWIAAIVLVALTISLGYRQGAVRASFSVLGVIIAAVLARPVAPLFNFIFNFVHVHPAVPQFVTPLIGFLVVSIVFTVVGSFVYRKIDYHYRYNVSDAHRAFWERMNRRVGASLGAMIGIVYFIVFALLVAVAGYFTYQTGGAESGSTVLSFIAKAAGDLKETRMDKVVAPFNPAPARYYEVSDLLGLLYHNRALKPRLEHYPVFAAMAERPLFKDIGSDPGAQKALDSGTLEEILANPKLQEVITNQALYSEFMTLDLVDLQKYLETGVSPKFAEQKILGRWIYNPDLSLQMNKSSHVELPASLWSRLKRELMERLDKSVVTAFFNNKTILQLSAANEGKSSPMRVAGVVRARNNQIVTNYVAAWLNTNAAYSATGTWSGSSPNYLITLGNKNRTVTSEAKVQANKLVFKFEDIEVAFDRIPD